MPKCLIQANKLSKDIDTLAVSVKPQMIQKIVDDLVDSSDQITECSRLTGDTSGLTGDLSGLWGEATGLVGSCTDLSGDLNQITQEDRDNDSDINSYII